MECFRTIGKCQDIFAELIEVVYYNVFAFLKVSLLENVFGYNVLEYLL